MPTGNSQRDVGLGNDFSAKMTDLILTISLVNYPSQASPRYLSLGLQPILNMTYTYETSVFQHTLGFDLRHSDL